MRNARNLHLWLLVPFAIVLLGFMPSYWLRLSEAPWRQHLHGISATLWFIILVAQPYLITRGNVRQHRLYGMFALFVAGGVVFSALSAIPYNIANETMPDAARYGLSLIDVIVITGFAFAVSMAIKTSKSVEDHARWMISTVFWALLPGLFRLVNYAERLRFEEERLLSPPQVLMAIAGLNVLVLGYLMFKDRRTHPAYVSAAGGNIAIFVALPISQTEWWRSFADTVFTI